MDPIPVPLAILVFGGLALLFGGTFIGARFFSTRIDPNDIWFQDQLPHAVRGLPRDLARRWAQELLEWSRSLDEQATLRTPCLLGGNGSPELCGLRHLAKPVAPPPDIHPSIRDFESFVGNGLAVCEWARTRLHKPTFFQDVDLTEAVPGASPSGLVCCVGDGVEDVDPCVSVDTKSGRCYVYSITEEDAEVFPTVFHGVLYLYLQECVDAEEEETEGS